MNFLAWLGVKLGITKMAEDSGSTNVLKFPEPKAVPQMPYIEPPKPATVFYRLGVTDNNTVSLQLGYSEIVMTKEGVENLIKQLEVFKSQISDNEDFV